MHTNIKNIDDFKIVMEAVMSIQTKNLTVELEINRLIETFNVLEEHDMNVCDFLLTFF